MTESVIKEWYHEPEVKEMCGKLVASMVERVKEVIKAKGVTFTINYTIKQINILFVFLLLYFTIVPTDLHSTVNTRVICLYVYLWFINDASK
jgi:hypothetical protein